MGGQQVGSPGGSRRTFVIFLCFIRSIFCLFFFYLQCLEFFADPGGRCLVALPSSGGRQGASGRARRERSGGQARRRARGLGRPSQGEPCFNR